MSRGMLNWAAEIIPMARHFLKPVMATSDSLCQTQVNAFANSPSKLPENMLKSPSNGYGRGVNK